MSEASGEMMLYLDMFFFLSFIMLWLNLPIEPNSNSLFPKWTCMFLAILCLTCLARESRKSLSMWLWELQKKETDGRPSSPQEPQSVLARAFWCQICDFKKKILSFLLVCVFLFFFLALNAWETLIPALKSMEFDCRREVLLHECVHFYT